MERVLGNVKSNYEVVYKKIYKPIPDNEAYSIYSQSQYLPAPKNTSKKSIYAKFKHFASHFSARSTI